MVDVLAEFVRASTFEAKSSRLQVFSILRGFFAANRAPLPEDRSIRLKGVPRSVGKMTDEDLRRIVMAAKLRDRSWLLVKILGFMGWKELEHMNLHCGQEVVRKMLDMAQLRRGEALFDLGCGDGRIVVIAARDYQAKAFGVEIREDLATAAQQQLRKFHVEERARIVQGNMFDVDLSEADVVTLYLSLSGNEKLKPKLERELRTNARVVSLDIQIKGWTPIRTSEAPGKHIIYLYRVGSN